MSRKVQLDQRKVGNFNSQSLSLFFWIFLLLKKSGSFNSDLRKYMLSYQSVDTLSDVQSRNNNYNVDRQISFTFSPQYLYYVLLIYPYRRSLHGASYIVEKTSTICNLRRRSCRYMINMQDFQKAKSPSFDAALQKDLRFPFSAFLVEAFEVDPVIASFLSGFW